MICSDISLNRDVTSPVVIDLNLEDRLCELKLAILQTKLQDLYEDVSLEVEQNAWGNNIRVSIWFNNPADKVHFIMSQATPTGLSEWVLSSGDCTTPPLVIPGTGSHGATHSI